MKRRDFLLGSILAPVCGAAVLLKAEPKQPPLVVIPDDTFPQTHEPQYRNSRNTLDFEDLRPEVYVLVISSIKVVTHIEQSDYPDFRTYQLWDNFKSRMKVKIERRYLRLLFYTDEPSEGLIMAWVYDPGNKGLDKYIPQKLE
jgi:hypothetical protein